MMMIMLHYNPLHVSSINMPIFRRTNCIITSDIVILSKRLYSMLDEIIQHAVQPFTDSDDFICCDNAICPPEDGHGDARNMSRIIM
jgi:hypothetical protein